MGGSIVIVPAYPFPFSRQSCPERYRACQYSKSGRKGLDNFWTLGGSRKANSLIYLHYPRVQLRAAGLVAAPLSEAFPCKN